MCEGSLVGTLFEFRLTKMLIQKPKGHGPTSSVNTLLSVDCHTCCISLLHIIDVYLRVVTMQVCLVHLAPDRHQ